MSENNTDPKIDPEIVMDLDDEKSTKQKVKEQIKEWFKPVSDFFKNIWYFFKSIYWKIKLIKAKNECERIEAKWHIENPDTGLYTVKEIIKNPDLCDELDLLSDITDCDRIDIGYSIETKKKACSDIGRIKHKWEGTEEGGGDGFSHDQLITSDKNCLELQKLIDHYKNDEEKSKYYQEIHDTSCRECGILNKEWEKNQYTPYDISRNRQLCRELDKLIKCYPEYSKYRLYCTPCGKLHAKWLHNKYTHEQIKRSRKRMCGEIERLIECANDDDISFSDSNYLRMRSESCDLCKNMEEDWEGNDFYDPSKIERSGNLCDQVIELHTKCDTKNPEVYEEYYKEICSDCIKTKNKWEKNNYTEENLKNNRDLCKMVTVLKDCEYLGEEHQTKFNDLYDRYCSECVLFDKNWVDTTRISYGPEDIYNSDTFCYQLKQMSECNHIDQAHKDIYADLWARGCSDCGKTLTRWDVMKYSDQVIASSEQLCEELDILHECDQDPKWLAQKKISCSECGKRNLVWKMKNNYGYGEGLAEKNLCFDLNLLTAKKSYLEDGTEKYCELSTEDKSTYNDIYTGLKCNLCDQYQTELKDKTDDYIIQNNDTTCDKLDTLIECGIDKNRYSRLYNKGCTPCGKALIKLEQEGINVKLDEDGEFKYDKDMLAKDLGIIKNGEESDGQPILCDYLHDINEADCAKLFDEPAQVDYLRTLYLRGCSDCMSKYNEWMAEHGTLKFTDDVPEAQRQGICDKIKVLKECKDSIISLPGEDIQDNKIEYTKIAITQTC